MELVDRIRSMSREQAGNMMVELLTVVSPDTFMKMALLAARLIEGDQAGAAVQSVRGSLLEGEDSQASRMFRRVMTDLAPHCLKTVAKTLFINGLLKSSALRRDFQRK